MDSGLAVEPVIIGPATWPDSLAAPGMTKSHKASTQT
jgi:hypothetical protein